ncbi:uncharacterized protein HMPREF1541_05059 [Cyphellophora europaea CBS 101466]|uniref:Protein-lysine N-methyltransferase EFM4 n=1 Tax=Cyphellophora europaea (strain CBS 101466) TaxID=1220924 RepID=W2RYL6_CYPE1|nr:uncharacterized protein HMPREF1541_05059 [Cyphellophora europaea CBS 101466]ETN40779.1 hypothetical protein HMPREF1541_05059 [Cyphellophora europaea CBS 101466]
MNQDDSVNSSNLESWFEDVGAPAKVLEYLTSDSFPLSQYKQKASVLDLGTGNGSALFSLRQEGGYTGPLVGIDYSDQGIQLANRLKIHFANDPEDERHIAVRDMTFDVFDLIKESPEKMPWWPKDGTGFDLVLDKGTFDAISLSYDTVPDVHGAQQHLNQVYPAKIAAMIKPNGFFLITSCNWTEDEIVRWFTTTKSIQGVFDVFDKIKYKVFEFGGRKGQGVTSVCFQKRA